MELEKVLALGYTQDDVNKIKSLYFMRNFKEETLYTKIQEIYSYLLRIGFNHNDIIIITRSYFGIFAFDSKNLELKINDLILLGYNIDELKKMIRENPKLLSVGVKSVVCKMGYLEDELGYSHEDVMKMSKKNSSLLEFSVETIKKKVLDLMSLGYGYEQVKRLTIKEPLLYKFSVGYIKKKIENMMSLGYTYDEVIDMTVNFPSIFNTSVLNMRKKIEDMMSLGYTRENVMKMTKILPTIYGLNIENIRMKKEFYDSIGLEGLLVIEPKQIMQSVDLSYARYMFYKSIGIEITMDNSSLLFVVQKRFEKKYGINKKDLINLYNYEDYRMKNNSKKK